LAIKAANKKDMVIKTCHFKKGMALVGINKSQMTGKKIDHPLEKLCVREFDAEVVILHHSTTIQENYQSVVHCGGIRQTARAIKIIGQKENEFLRTGDKGLIRFRFMHYPELLREGSTIMFREGRTKGLGYVTKVYKGK